MSLFDLAAKENTKEEVIESNTPSDFINAASLKYFKSILKNVKSNRHYHFVTGGQWNMYELMAYVLTITGSADLWKCTWAISEDPVRAIIDLKKRNVIRSIKCILDYKVPDQKSKAYLLAKSNFDFIALSRCHAKVTVIKNKKWSVSIFGSANDTRNPRIERCCVCTVPEVAEEDIRWMEAVMNNENIFKVR
jgi:hypothetical protein